MITNFDVLLSKLNNKLISIAECIYSRYKNERPITQNWGVYDGNCGIILFLFYYAKYTQNSKYAKLAELLVTKLLDHFFCNITLSSFSSGLSGILYLFVFFKEYDFIDIDIGDYKDELEQSLTVHMRKEIKNKRYDFMHGALGIGMYFLKDNYSTKSVLELTNFLYETAEKDFNNKIFKWKSIVNYEKGEKGYNISLSHGISSIVLFLSKAIQANLSNDKISEMLEGAVNYILSQEYHDIKGLSLFPSQSKENKVLSMEGKYSRLAWCYGDLGVGLALFKAGRSVKNKKWTEKGLHILECSTARHDPLQNYVFDAGICHGSAGIAMIYKRLYLDTNKRSFCTACQYWLNVTLEMDHFEDGLAGYKTFQNKWVSDYSLLTGISGIGMLLLSVLYDDKQEWDKIFLLT